MINDIIINKMLMINDILIIADILMINDILMKKNKIALLHFYYVFVPHS